MKQLIPDHEMRNQLLKAANDPYAIKDGVLQNLMARVSLYELIGIVRGYGDRIDDFKKEHPVLVPVAEALSTLKIDEKGEFDMREVLSAIAHLQPVMDEERRTTRQERPKPANPFSQLKP